MTYACLGTNRETDRRRSGQTRSRSCVSVFILSISSFGFCCQPKPKAGAQHPVVCLILFMIWKAPGVRHSLSNPGLDPDANLFTPPPLPPCPATQTPSPDPNPTSPTLPPSPPTPPSTIHPPPPPSTPSPHPNPHPTRISKTFTQL